MVGEVDRDLTKQTDDDSRTNKSWAELKCLEAVSQVQGFEISCSQSADGEVFVNDSRSIWWLGWTNETVNIFQKAQGGRVVEPLLQ